MNKQLRGKYGKHFWINSKKIEIVKIHWILLLGP